jgi:hypothetical protein
MNRLYGNYPSLTRLHWLRHQSRSLFDCFSPQSLINTLVDSYITSMKLYMPCTVWYFWFKIINITVFKRNLRGLQPYVFFPLEIIRKVRKPPPLCRPSVSQGAAPPQYIQIMKQCWSEMPDMRPTFEQINSQIKEINKGKLVECYEYIQLLTFLPFIMSGLSYVHLLIIC